MAPFPTLQTITTGDSHFFGFHDLTPWNPATNEIVCLRTRTSEDHVPTHNESAEVVVIDERSGKVTTVSETTAWNWQMGARQRWLPHLGRRVLMFNASSPDYFECRIVNLDAGTTKVLPFPVFDAHDARRFGLSPDFVRLRALTPAYGYDHKSDLQPREYSKDGIWRVDLETGDVRLILTLENFLGQHRIDHALGHHYFTHISIAPSGLRFCFLHRCFLPSGGLINNLVVANCDGTEARIVGSDKLSHFDWKDDEQIIIWCRRNATVQRLKESKMRWLVRPLYKISKLIKLNAVRQGIYNESFREINLTSGHITEVGRKVLTEDGHPQLHPRHRDLWINDTYPNREHVQTLMLYHQSSNRRVDLLRLRTPAQIDDRDWRCDLHPRWHPNGERVCIDSAHLGRRQLCTLDVSKEVRALVTDCQR